MISALTITHIHVRFLLFRFKLLLLHSAAKSAIQKAIYTRPLYHRRPHCVCFLTERVTKEQQSAGCCNEAPLVNIGYIHCRYTTTFGHQRLLGPRIHVELRCLINLSQLAVQVQCGAGRHPSVLQPTPSVVNGGRASNVIYLHGVPNDVSEALTTPPHISMVMLITPVPQASLESKLLRAALQQ